MCGGGGVVVLWCAAVQWEPGTKNERNYLDSLSRHVSIGVSAQLTSGCATQTGVFTMAVKYALVRVECDRGGEVVDWRVAVADSEGRYKQGDVDIIHANKKDTITRTLHVKVADSMTASLLSDTIDCVSGGAVDLEELYDTPIYGQGTLRMAVDVARSACWPDQYAKYEEAREVAETPTDEIPLS